MLRNPLGLHAVKAHGEIFFDLLPRPGLGEAAPNGVKQAARDAALLVSLVAQCRYLDRCLQTLKILGSAWEVPDVAHRDAEHARWHEDRAEQ